MSTIIKMPAFSATMEAGKLLSWVVAPGDAFAKGQVLAEVETDKAVATIEAPEAGRVVELLVTAGDDDVPVNAGLAVVQFEGEPAAVTPAAASAYSVAATAAPVAQPVGQGSTPPPPRRLRASPAARALARKRGIDLGQVAGSGPRGRIVRADLNGVPKPAAAGPGAAAVAATSGDRAAQMRRAMARALVHAKATVPHFYAEVDIGLDALLALRRQVAASAAEGRGPTITAYLIRAAALALREVPAANRSWAEDAIQQRSACHVGCAVGLPERVALPVVRDADRMTVQQIGQDLQRLTALARADALTQRDMGDASLTISNLGMHGIDRFFPIINVPEALMLGIGQARRVVSVVGDLIGVRTVMSCTASVDHRVVDGELAGRFLQSFRRVIESPQQLAD
ncbi:MAG: 2-oxo acid dehydrogenase subunit E2 [Steroidobacteraceae bacterium]|jgi:pyruvate dehydrogenase E2 component (dihydrolipoamide acetyltransferase)|nr:2-oxo acid dehydrogenase subunit E2 [Steroidobacteraceae bacterium]